MKKRLCSIIAAFALLLTLLPTAALAAEGGARDTDFFPAREHADLNCSEMTFERVDADAVLREMDAVRALAADSANTDAVREGFASVRELAAHALDLYMLAYIRTAQDAADEAAAEDLQSAVEAYSIVMDGLYLLARDILSSPCAAALDDLLTDEDREDLAEYEGLTGGLLSLQQQDTALVNEYWNRLTQGFSADYDGRTWDYNTAEEAYLNGELDYDTYLAVVTAIAKEENRVEGTIYLKLLSLRRQAAALNGSDDYCAYMYEAGYDRDYTPEESRAFHAAVKEFIVPIYRDMYTLYLDCAYNDVFRQDSIGDEAVEIIGPYLARMSDELLESYHYMVEHGLYDMGLGENRTNQGFTAMLPGCNAAFIYMYGWNAAQDLITTIHEFGHYNDAYWTEYNWSLNSKSNDISEVHSQGLELLFTEFYPELFGEDAETLETFTLYKMLDAIVQGTLYDEFQQYAYGTEDVTLQQLNEEFCRLCREYGVISEDDPRTEMYSWVEVNHNFDSPCYYISYAVSAAGALAFWLEAQEDYYGAVDDYLRFTALDVSCSFSESFAALGMEDPMDAAYLKDLAQTLRAELDIDARLAARPETGSFTDVQEDDWFCEAVSFVCGSGLFSGTGDTTFEPDTALSRAMLVTVLYRLAGSPENETASAYSDVAGDAWYTDGVIWAEENGVTTGCGDGRFGPNDAITREQLAVMLYRGFGNTAEGTGQTLDFSDADKVSDWALDAVRWAVSEGILNGRGGGTLDPQGEATRAEAAQMLMNLCINE